MQQVPGARAFHRSGFPELLLPSRSQQNQQKYAEVSKAKTTVRTDFHWFCLVLFGCRGWLEPRASCGLGSWRTLNHTPQAFFFKFFKTMRQGLANLMSLKRGSSCLGLPITGMTGVAPAPRPTALSLAQHFTPEVQVWAGLAPSQAPGLPGLWPRHSMKQNEGLKAKRTKLVLLAVVGAGTQVSPTS